MLFSYSELMEMSDEELLEIAGTLPDDYDDYDEYGEEDCKIADVIVSRWMKEVKARLNIGKDSK